jgi:hypothetical protein
MRVYLLDDQVPVFPKPDGTAIPLARLAARQEIELGRTLKSGGADWVEAVLPDGRRGYIAGETKIHEIKLTALKQDEADMLEQPSFHGARKARLVKGQKFYLLHTVPGEGGSWVRIRDLQGREGYIHGDTSIVKDEKTAPPPSAGGTPPAPKPARKGATDIRNGLVAIALGLIATFGSRALAPQLGGRYYVTWGMVVLGAFWLLRGLGRRLRR